MVDSNPPTSPSVNIKEEPIDEGYDAALLPQSSIRQIKEELEQQEVGMKRERLYSAVADDFLFCLLPNNLKGFNLRMMIYFD